MCTMGASLYWPICVMHPILPAVMGRQARDVHCFPLSQLPGKVGLQQVVGSRGTTAEVRFRYVLHE